MFPGCAMADTYLHVWPFQHAKPQKFSSHSVNTNRQISANFFQEHHPEEPLGKKSCRKYRLREEWKTWSRFPWSWRNGQDDVDADQKMRDCHRAVGHGAKGLHGRQLHSISLPQPCPHPLYRCGRRRSNASPSVQLSVNLVRRISKELFVQSVREAVARKSFRSPASASPDQLLCRHHDPPRKKRGQWGHRELMRIAISGRAFYVNFLVQFVFLGDLRETMAQPVDEYLPIGWAEMFYRVDY